MWPSQSWPSQSWSTQNEPAQREPAQRKREKEIELFRAVAAQMSALRERVSVAWFICEACQRLVVNEPCGWVRDGTGELDERRCLACCARCAACGEYFPPEHVLAHLATCVPPLLLKQQREEAVPEYSRARKRKNRHRRVEEAWRRAELAEINF